MLKQACVLTCFIIILFPQTGQAKTILFLGDSLTIGKGVLATEAYPVLVQQKLQKQSRIKVDIINASRSGSTTKGALARFNWLASQRKIDVLFLALGANDGLRALPVASIEANLSRVIIAAQKKRITIVLAGMYMLPNYGKQYTKAFAHIFPKLAKKYHLILVPFLLDKVAGEKKYNQADGIHPTAKGHVIIAHTVFPYIQKALRSHS